MSRDLSGTYTLPENTQAITGETLSSVKYNAINDDIAAALNAPWPASAGLEISVTQALDGIAAMAASTTLIDSGYVVISPTGETFKYDAASTLTPDGVLVVDATGMGAGRLVSTRTEYASFAELEGDVRIFAAGVDFNIPSIGASYQSTDAATIVANAGGQNYNVLNKEIYLSHYGVVFDGTTDQATKIQAVIDLAETKKGATSQPSVFVYSDNGQAVLIASGVTIPASVVWAVNGGAIKYTGTGTAIQIGASSTVLNYYAGLDDFRLLLTDKDAKAIRMLCTTECNLNGYIEPLYQPFDSTRTNVGIEFDGGDASNFGNMINVKFQHCHESVRFMTSGTSYVTSQVFLDCYIFGDQTTDTTSVGFNFVDDALGRQVGEGTKIVGGNIEAVNTGFYFGNGCGNIDVNTRFEINGTATSRIANYHSNTKNIHIQGGGLNAAQIGALAAGFENFGAGTGHSIRDANGNERVAGGNSSNAGWTYTKPIRDSGVLTHFFAADQNVAFYMDSTNTGTGRLLWQAGKGSGAYGAYMAMHAHTHATKAGILTIGGSSGKSTEITNGLGGSVLWRASTAGLQPGADNTYDIGAAATRVKNVYAKRFYIGSTGMWIDGGSGTPEGVQSAPVGSQWHRTDGGAGTSFYIKESGTGNTGWVAK